MTKLTIKNLGPWWFDDWFSGRVLSKECTNELQPVLPSAFTQVLVENSDTMNSAKKQIGLSVVSNMLSYNEMVRLQNCSILDSIERGGPTVKFTATLQRIFRQSSTTGVRYQTFCSYRQVTSEKSVTCVLIHWK